MATSTFVGPAKPVKTLPGLVVLRSIEQALRNGTAPNHARMDSASYAMHKRMFWAAPIVTGYGYKPWHDMPSAEDEKNATRFPSLNRKGNASHYSIPMHVDATSLTDAQRAEWQDRMIQLRQFAMLAGISINGKDYSKTLSVRGKSSNTRDGRGPMYDCTHTSRWDGGKYDGEAAKRAAEKMALATDRALYPWLYDARGKRRVPQIDATGNVCFGPKGRTVSVRDLMSHHKSEQCKVDCATDATASAIRMAAALRNGDKELQALIDAQKQDLAAQKRGKALLVTVAELTD